MFRANKVLLAFASLHFLNTLIPIVPVFAQEAPTDEFIFDEDSERKQRLLQLEREQIQKKQMQAITGSSKVDFEAPNVEYLQEENKLKGTGGVLVSAEGLQLEADEGELDLDTKDGSFTGDVLLTTPDGVIEADRSDFNLDYETGTFYDADFSIEEGAYLIHAEEAQRITEKRFRLNDCFLSTCHCDDGSRPWRISGDEMDVTREGYAHAYGSSISFQGVPFFYSPWLAFPVKEERASGLLVPMAGYSNRDGVSLRQPILAVIDDHSDMLFEPFFASRTRRGSAFEYRNAFSTRSNLHTRLLYSDESPRDGMLRGTNVTDVFDPTIDEDRFGGFYRQNWQSDPSSIIPTSFIANVNYVSDNLLLREMDESEIGESNSRYVNSDVVLRSSFGDYVTTSLEGEYNQSLLTDQDLVFHRLPEARVNALRSFRPFGFHPLGLKVTTKADVQATNFSRDTGFEGMRYDIRPSVKVPLHYKNYVNMEFEAGIRQTIYDLGETFNPTISAQLPFEDLDDSNDRTLPDASVKVNTAIERVFELPEETWIKDVTALGSEAGEYELQRLKHTFVPGMTFQYVPDTTQTDLPIFDAIDRLREKSLVALDLRNSLYGSFKPRGQLPPQQIEELAPEVQDFGRIRDNYLLGDLDNLYGTEDVFARQNIRKGRNMVRELASFRLLQSYDYIEDVDDNDPNRDAFSDLGAIATIFPTPQFALSADTNYNVQEEDVSSWGLATHFRDDRGDVLRVRYSFIDESISQLTGNLQIALTDQLQVGYFARFDELESDFIEQRAALRLKSACNCWHIDFGVSEQVNPDRQRFLFSFTLRGLGDLTEEFGFRDDPDRDNT